MRALLLTSILSFATACTPDDSGGFGGGGSASDATYDGGSSGDGGGGGGDGGSDTGGQIDTGAGDGGGGDGGEDTGFSIEGTGYGQGDVAYDLTAVDETGAPFSLHELYGTNVVVAVGHMYNGGQLEGMMQYFSSISGAQVVVLMGVNENDTVATQEDAARWSSQYGVRPVLFDTSQVTFASWSSGQQSYLYVIDKQMEIQWTNSGFTAEVQLQDKIDAL